MKQSARRPGQRQRSAKNTYAIHLARPLRQRHGLARVQLPGRARESWVKRMGRPAPLRPVGHRGPVHVGCASAQHRCPRIGHE
eukprot:1264569-Alexandrium_andersonii.AAC.1